MNNNNNMNIPAPAPSPESSPVWKNRAFWILGQRVTLLAGGEQTGGAFSLIDILAPPGVPAPPPHFHRDCAETFHVTEGALEILTGEEWLTVYAGSSCLVPAGAAHTFRNPGAAPARTVSVFSPAGFERFFEDLGSPVMDPSGPAPPVTPELIARVLTEAGRYGMEIQSPPRAAGEARTPDHGV